MKTEFIEFPANAETGTLEDMLFDLGQRGFSLQETTPVFMNTDYGTNITESKRFLSRFQSNTENKYVYMAGRKHKIPKLERDSLASMLNESLQPFEQAGFCCVSTISHIKISGNREFRSFGSESIRMILEKEIEPARWKVFKDETDRLLALEQMGVFYAEDKLSLKLKEQQKPDWIDSHYDSYDASHMNSWREFISIIVEQQSIIGVSDIELSRKLALLLGIRERCEIKKTVFRMIVMIDGICNNDGKQ